MRRNRNSYYQWRVNGLNGKWEEFTNYLIDLNCDIFTKRERGEMVKFRAKEGFGIAFESGMANPIFNSYAKRFLKEMKK